MSEKSLAPKGLVENESVAHSAASMTDSLMDALKIKKGKKGKRNKFSEKVGDVVVAEAERVKRVEEESRIDKLTGLPNRQAGDEMLKVEVARCKRHKRELILAVLDVDNFKSVNDNFSHSAGDKVLKGVAKVLKEAVREEDFVSRWGGDEFVVLLPDTEYLESLSVIRRIQTKITEKFGEEYGIGITAGVAEFGDKMNTPKKMFKWADEALLMAKDNESYKIGIVDNAGIYNVRN